MAGSHRSAAATHLRPRPYPAHAPDPALTPRTVLVTGATGYIGGRLVPRLLRDGHTVRTTVTDPRRPKQAWWSDRVQTVPMDIRDPHQVAAACDGVDSVYFLVHALSERGFAARDRTAAWNMRAAVERQGVERIVYLSGIVPPVPGTQLSERPT